MNRSEWLFGRVANPAIYRFPCVQGVERERCAGGVVNRHTSPTSAARAHVGVCWPVPTQWKRARLGWRLASSVAAPMGRRTTHQAGLAMERITFSGFWRA